MDVFRGVQLMSCLSSNPCVGFFVPGCFASLAVAGIVGQAMAADPGAATTPAPAADQGTGTGLQEVLVTAQFQSQNVQSTPLAITALSAAALAERGADQYY